MEGFGLMMAHDLLLNEVQGPNHGGQDEAIAPRHTYQRDKVEASPAAVTWLP